MHHFHFLRRIQHVRFFCATAIFFAAACTQVPHHETLRKHEDDHQHQGDEILVMNPSAEYLAALPRLGLKVREVTELSALGSKLYHLDIVNGRHPFHTREHHERAFPDIDADLHHHFEHHAKRSPDKGYTPRNAAQWTKAGAGCGRNIRIGVIDGEIDLKHKAFEGIALMHRSFSLPGQKPPNGVHGTAVAAIVAGAGAWGGLVPGVTLYTANVFHRNKAGKNVGSTKAILEAVNWMVSEKVAVINLSIGGPPNRLLARAVKLAHDKGVLMVASAGNNGPFTDKKSYPAAYKSVIAVTALDRNGTSPRFASVGDYIDFAAPGVDIWTAVPRGGRAMSGTSFAAPIIAAFAAAAMQNKDIKTADSLRTYLRKFAKDRNKSGWDRYTGWGLVEMRPPC